MDHLEAVRYVSKGTRPTSLVGDTIDIVILDLDDFFPEKPHKLSLILGEAIHALAPRARALKEITSYIHALSDAIESSTHQLGPSIIVIGPSKLNYQEIRKITETGAIYLSKPDTDAIWSDDEKIRYVRSHLLDRFSRMPDASQADMRAHVYGTTAYIARPNSIPPDAPPITLSDDDLNALFESTRLPSGSWKRND